MNIVIAFMRVERDSKCKGYFESPFVWYKKEAALNDMYYGQLQKRLYPSNRQPIMIPIAKSPLVIKSIMVIPMAIQNRIKPIILFI
jgi:hypothetical protein